MILVLYRILVLSVILSRKAPWNKGLRGDNKILFLSPCNHGLYTFRLAPRPHHDRILCKTPIQIPPHNDIGRAG